MAFVSRCITLLFTGVSHVDCVEKMRLLSICSLASQQPEVPYALLATTLQIEVCEVEYWVVKAIMAGLLEAKMDQLREVVAVQ